MSEWSDPALFVFYKNWASQAALDVHLETPHLQDITPRVAMYGNLPYNFAKRGFHAARTQEAAKTNQKDRTY